MQNTMPGLAHHIKLIPPYLYLRHHSSINISLQSDRRDCSVSLHIYFIYYRIELEVLCIRVIYLGEINPSGTWNITSDKYIFYIHSQQIVKSILAQILKGKINLLSTRETKNTDRVKSEREKVDILQLQVVDGEE